MYDILEKDNIKIENLIYEINGIQIMVDSEVSVTKCHDYKHDILITHYDIGKPISVFIKERRILWN